MILKFFFCAFSTLVIIVIIGTLYSLTTYVTLPGSIILLILMLWLLLRKIIEISLFPGSTWFWKRGVEFNYCKEMCIQISDKIKHLREYMTYILSSNLTLQELYSQNGKNTINSIIENYEGMQCKLSGRQNRLCELLKDLRSELLNTTVVVNDNDSFPLWQWIEIRLECPPITSIRSTDTSNTSSIASAIALCREIENLLLRPFENTNCLNRLVQWLLNDTVGTIDYMRVDLMNRFSCEEIIIPNGRVKISW